MATKEYTNIAIGDIGTQFFWFNKDNLNKATTGAFEYALPVTAGAEFGGDRESFEAPETDLDYVPKIGGRNSLNDIEYTVNYTKEKYARIVEITHNTIGQVYMEVFQDGSCAIFKGTSGIPTITSGDVRQLTLGITPDFLLVIQNIYSLTTTEEGKLDSLAKDLIAIYKTDDKPYTTLKLYDSTTHKLNIDVKSIPTARLGYKADDGSAKGTEEPDAQ